jgi:acetylglutamate kinase
VTATATTQATDAQAPAQGVPAGDVVVKVGGAVLQDPETAPTLARGLADLRSQGVRPLVVHGGGPQVTEVLEAADEDPTFQDGLRFTPPEALEAAEAALAAVGKRLAGALTARGLAAVALSGRDGHLVQAEARPGLGAVGQVTDVDAAVLRFLAFNGLVPVLGPPAVDADGDPLNVNADEVAAAAAAALGADALVLLTDADGVHDAEGRVDHVDPADLAALRDQAAEGGMVPKLHAAQSAHEGGVDRVLVARADRPLPDLLAGDAPATTVAPEAPK